jgi:hypothetical protein
LAVGGWQLAVGGWRYKKWAIVAKYKKKKNIPSKNNFIFKL